MKAILIAAALAVGTTAFATVPSQAASVTITTRDDGWHDNGNHYGWYKKRFHRNRGCEVRRQVIWRDGERIVRTVRECRR
jgi:Spy/CpxP family protein refolding chaperone